MKMTIYVGLYPIIFFCNGVKVLNMIEDILPYKFQLLKTQGTIASS